MPLLYLRHLVVLGLLYISLSPSSGHINREKSIKAERHLEWFDDDSETESSEPSSEKATEKSVIDELFDDDEEDEDDEAALSTQELKQRIRKKYTRVHKAIFPLLIAYKLKFFTMVPILIGTLVLLLGTTGMAGFFFALFAAAAGLHKNVAFH